MKICWQLPLSSGSTKNLMVCYYFEKDLLKTRIDEANKHRSWAPTTKHTYAARKSSSKLKQIQQCEAEGYKMQHFGLDFGKRFIWLSSISGHFSST